jgi:hypothetical protein
MLAVLLLVAAPLAAPLAVRACPLCADAIANANGANNQDDVDSFPSAMNQSIYLMIAVPYTALGVVGFLIYRGMKQNDEYRKAQDETPAETGPVA